MKTSGTLARFNLTHHPMRPCRAWLALGLLALLAGAPEAFAQRAWVNTSGGAWETAGNWSPSGTPAAGEQINLNLPSVAYTVTIDDTTADTDAGWMTIGNLALYSPSPLKGSPTLLINFTNTAKTLAIGNASSGILAINSSYGHYTTGTVKLVSGRLSAHTVYLGQSAYNGPALLQVDANGNVEVLSTLFVGLNGAVDNRANGRLLLHGGSFVSKGANCYVGSSGMGTLDVFGGSMNSALNSGSYLTVGSQPGATGKMTLQDGSVRLGGSGLIVGSSVGSTGNVWVTGGTLYATNSGLNLIVANYGVARMTVSNGTVRANPAAWTVGSQANSDGGLTIAGGESYGTSLGLAANAAAATGTLTMVGGTLVIAGGNVLIGNRGVAWATLSGGTLINTNSTGAFYVANEGGSFGRFDVSGGLARLYAMVIGSKTNTLGVGANGATTISDRGVLELSASLTLGEVGCVGVLTNRNGGTLRFMRQNDPTIILRAGAVVVTNAAAEFKDAPGAYLMGGFANLSVQANSLLRLNHSTNNTSGVENYGVGDGRTFAGLELANISRWKGVSLTISTNGWLLATNGAAAIGCNVTVLDSGYVRVGTAGVLTCERSFLNRSINSAAFDFAAGTLRLADGAGNQHVVETPALAGALTMGEATNRFLIGTLQLAAGETLKVTGGAGTALYAGAVDIGGLGNLNNLTLDVDLFYDDTLAANAWLGGMAYRPTGSSGQLRPMRRMTGTFILVR